MYYSYCYLVLLQLFPSPDLESLYNRNWSSYTPFTKRRAEVELLKYFLQQLLSRKHMNRSRHKDWTHESQNPSFPLSSPRDLLPSTARECISVPLKQGRKLTTPKIIHNWLVKDLTRNTLSYFKTHNAHPGCHKPGHSPACPFQAQRLSPSGSGSSERPILTARHCPLLQQHQEQPYLAPTAQWEGQNLGWVKGVWRQLPHLQVAMPLSRWQWQHLLGGASSYHAPTAPAPTAKGMPFSDETLIWIKPLRAAGDLEQNFWGTSGFSRPPSFFCPNSGPPVFKHVRARQRPSMKLLGLQFWITVAPNCCSGLVIYFGEGPKFLSYFKESQCGKVRDRVESWCEVSVQMCIWKGFPRRHFAISYGRVKSHLSCSSTHLHLLSAF